MGTKQGRNLTVKTGSEDDRLIESVRLATETLYVVTDLSLAQLMEQEPLRGTDIHLRTVEAWCRKGGWVEKRSAFQAGWRRRALEELGDQAIQARLRQIEKLRIFSDQMYRKAMSGKCRPRSLEGLANAMCKVVETSNILCDSLLALAGASKQAERCSIPSDAELELAGVDDSVFLEAVHTVLKNQRNQPQEGGKPHD